MTISNPNMETNAPSYLLTPIPFVVIFKTEDLSQDMSQNLDLFDTSNFNNEHPLYKTKNHRVLGKFKSETGSLAPGNLWV